MEIIPDANSPEEQVWVGVLISEDQLVFPFKAVCINKRAISHYRS